LDDIEKGSGDDDSDGPVVPAQKPRRQTLHAVSPITRDLIDFLADGPPDSPPADNQSMASPDSSKSKSSRLQKMMSKLYIGAERQGRPPAEENVPKSSYRPPSGPTLNTKSSHTSLANYPVPPRYPMPSPPSPPGSTEDVSSTSPPHKPPVPRKAGSTWEQKTQPPAVQGQSPTTVRHSSPGLSPVESNVTKSVAHTSTRATTPSKPVVQTSPVSKKGTAHEISLNDAQDIRRLMAKATNADECRVLLDMLLAKCGVPINAAKNNDPYPSPTPSSGGESETYGADVELRHSLVEFLLGGGEDPYDDTVSEDAMDTEPEVTDTPIVNGHTVSPGIDKDTPRTVDATA
jgi:hypothetical protein